MNKSIILEFIDRINARDVEGITTYLADDHVFIDAHDHLHEGKHLMKKASSN